MLDTLPPMQIDISLCVKDEWCSAHTEPTWSFGVKKQVRLSWYWVNAECHSTSSWSKMTHLGTFNKCWVRQPPFYCRTAANTNVGQSTITIWVTQRGVFFLYVLSCYIFSCWNDQGPRMLVRVVPLALPLAGDRPHAGSLPGRWTFRKAVFITFFNLFFSAGLVDIKA
jgi:hypothetical protein